MGICRGSNEVVRRIVQNGNRIAKYRLIRTLRGGLEMSLEQALAALSIQSSAAQKAVSNLTARLNGTVKAADAGDLRNLKAELSQLRLRMGELSQQVEQILGWDFDGRGYLASGAYLRELVKEAAAI